jgi:hypothetical protein
MGAGETCKDRSCKVVVGVSPPLDHICPRCDVAIPADAVLVDADGSVRRECPACRRVAPVEVTAR